MEDLIPMVVMTGMFAMIFGIVYIKSRENMAMIERGLNPRQKNVRPRPFVNLKYGLLLIGSGLGLLFAYIIDSTLIPHDSNRSRSLITITTDGHSKKNKITIVDTNANKKDTSISANNTSFQNGNDGEDDSDDDDNVTKVKKEGHDDNPAIYFSLIAIGGGLGLFLSYRIEKKEWLDKKIEE